MGFRYDSFVQARWYYAGRKAKPRIVVVHCTVSKEMGTGAESVARYFSTATRKGSSHAVADSDSVVGCVKDGDTAFGAAGANADGLHLELVGLPDQTLAQWLDEFDRAMFAKAAPLLDYWSATYSIPLRWLSVAEVADGRSRGLCTHADVSKAFPAVSTGHWDPGPYFPKIEFLKAAAPVPPAPPDLDMEDPMVRDAVDMVTFAYRNYSPNKRLPTGDDLKGHAGTIVAQIKAGKEMEAVATYANLVDALAKEPG